MPTIAALELEAGMVAPTPDAPDRLRKAATIAAVALAAGCLGAAAGYASTKHRRAPMGRRTAAMASLQAEHSTALIMSRAVDALSAAGDEAGRAAVLAGREAAERRIADEAVLVLVDATEIEFYPVSATGEPLAWPGPEASDLCAVAYEVEGAWDVAAQGLAQKAALSDVKKQRAVEAAATMTARADDDEKARIAKALEVARGALCVDWPLKSLPPSLYEQEMRKGVRKGAERHVHAALRDLTKAAFGSHELLLADIAKVSAAKDFAPVLVLAALADLAASGDHAGRDAVLSGAKGVVERMSNSQMLPATSTIPADAASESGLLFKEAERVGYSADGMPSGKDRAMAAVCATGSFYKGWWMLAVERQQVAVDVSADEQARISKALDAAHRAVCANFPQQHVE